MDIDQKIPRDFTNGTYAQLLVYMYLRVHLLRTLSLQCRSLSGATDRSDAQMYIWLLSAVKTWCFSGLSFFMTCMNPACGSESFPHV